jgi:AraC-like DNA-binding protein
MEGLTLTDTVYTHDRVDWHYHENAYFTFILRGGVVEGNHKEVYECGPGALLYHNWQDPHYNIKSPQFTRGMHIELSRGWMETLAEGCRDLSGGGGLGRISSLGRVTGVLQGSLRLEHPGLKLIFYKIFRESLIGGDLMELSIQQLLGEVHHFEGPAASGRAKPRWVGLVRDLLHAGYAGSLSLKEIAAAAGIHPVHLSRDFRKYFGCSLGDYIRGLRLERALTLLGNSAMSLTHIALECGFADQAHFVRLFKASQGITPSAYRRLLTG